MTLVAISATRGLGGWSAHRTRVDADHIAGKFRVLVLVANCHLRVEHPPLDRGHRRAAVGQSCHDHRELGRVKVFPQVSNEICQVRFVLGRLGFGCTVGDPLEPDQTGQLSVLAGVTRKYAFEFVAHGALHAVEQFEVASR